MPVLCKALECVFCWFSGRGRAGIPGEWRATGGLLVYLGTGRKYRLLCSKSPDHNAQDCDCRDRTRQGEHWLPASPLERKERSQRPELFLGWLMCPSSSLPLGPGRGCSQFWHLRGFLLLLLHCSVGDGTQGLAQAEQALYH